MDDLIARLTESFRQYDPTRTQVPARSGVFYREPEWRLVEMMPAHLAEPAHDEIADRASGARSGTTVKLVGYHPTNPERRNLPTVISTVCLFDAHSGHLSALVDGTFLTAIRTGAASAVASRAMAHPGSRTVGVIGCGAQAVTQLHALARLFEVDTVLAHDINDGVASSFQQRVDFLGIEIEAVGRDRLPDLVAVSDILCTCTSAAPGDGPIFVDGPHRQHLHINAVGSDFRGKFEVPVELLRRALVCPDFREQAIIEGECQQLVASEIGPDFTTVLQNDPESATIRSQPTVFDSTGWALEDHIAAQMLVDYANELGLGQQVALECLPPDPTDPYSFLPAAAQPATANRPEEELTAPPSRAAVSS